MPHAASGKNIVLRPVSKWNGAPTILWASVHDIGPSLLFRVDLGTITLEDCRNGDPPPALIRSIGWLGFCPELLFIASPAHYLSQCFAVTLPPQHPGC